MRRCKDYCGLACIDGTCPIANREEYEEWGIPVVESCEECHMYKGCKDCCLEGTEYCPNPKENRCPTCAECKSCPAAGTGVIYPCPYFRRDEHGTEE